MNAIGLPVVPPKKLHKQDIERCVRDLRAFLTQSKLDKVRAELLNLAADGNRFRAMAREEGLPWLAAFDEFDRLTLRGARRLPTARPLPGMYETAWVGLTLQQVRRDLPPKQCERMSECLRDYRKSMGSSVLMEWSTALFYQRHGFHLLWKEHGEAGCEFRAERDGLTLEVECKRIFRRSKDRLDFRGAGDLAFAVVQALGQSGWCGHVVCDTAEVKMPPMADLLAAIKGALPTAPSEPTPINLTIPGLGSFTGTVQPIPAQEDRRLWDEAKRQATSKPHDHRSFCGPVPSDADSRAPVVVWVRGPRFTEAEHLQHIKSVPVDAASQFSGTVPGLVFIEIEDVKDGAVFEDKAVFREAAAETFAAHPSVVAVVWRTEQEVVQVPAGFLLRQEVVVDWNKDGPFGDMSHIPINDM